MLRALRCLKVGASSGAGRAEVTGGVGGPAEPQRDPSTPVPAAIYSSATCCQNTIATFLPSQSLGIVSFDTTIYPMAYASAVPCPCLASAAETTQAVTESLAAIKPSPAPVRHGLPL